MRTSALSISPTLWVCAMYAGRWWDGVDARI